MDWVTSFSLVDFALIGLLLIGALLGLARGLSGELARAAAVVIAVPAGYFLLRPVGDLLLGASRLTANSAYATAFVLVVLGVLLVFWLIRLLLRQLIEWSFKGRGERIGGLFAGLLRTSLLLFFVYLLVHLYPHDFLYRHLVSESLIGTQVSKLVVPLYRDIAEDHPDWKLPEIGIEVEDEDGNRAP